MQDPCSQEHDVPFSGLVPAVLHARPNRFLLDVRLSGARVEAACTDPGRLERLLVPGAQLLLQPAPPAGGGAGARRRTRYTAVLARQDRAWVSVLPVLANRIVQFALMREGVQELRGAVVIGREVRVGTSRIDFLLRHRRRDVLMEVKSASWVEEGTALFPDAPTARGARHVRELTAHARAGGRAALLFVVQRDGAVRLVPHRGRDPRLAEALLEAAAAGVQLLAYGCAVGPDGCRLGQPMPVDLGRFP